jgi:hypothetical protein
MCLMRKCLHCILLFVVSTEVPGATAAAAAASDGVSA